MKIQNLPILKKLIFTFAILITLSSTMIIYSIYQMSKTNKISQEINNITIPSLQKTMSLNSMINEFKAAEVNLILYKDNSDKEKRIKHLENIKENIKKTTPTLLNLLTSTEDKKYINDFNINWSDYISGSDEVLALLKDNKKNEALDVWNDQVSVKIFDVTREQLEKLKDKKINEANKITQDSQQTYNLAVKLIQIGIISLVTISLFLSYFIMKNIKQTLLEAISQLTEGNNVLNALSKNLYEASEKLNQSASSQASMVQESAATIEEVSSMVSKTAENASSSTSLVANSNNEAELGKNTVKEMVNSINEISNQNNTMVLKIEESNQRLDEIVKIIIEINNKAKVINDIVFQTKLLSFNASVEAARAGDQGKGFAVVAEEVANLAQMSGKAANEISEILNKSLHIVNETVTKNKEEMGKLSSESNIIIKKGLIKAQECEESLTKIVASSSEVTLMVKEISSATKEQASGVHEMSKAINIIDSSTQDNAIMAKETSKFSESLNIQIETITASLESLQEKIGIKMH